ncbi:spore coat U domain-containing protein [Aestuariivirga sp.]|uniref:Csu type fimbrial protein n=1 Tax=Aestuariivirga sp. TaxID=2650926 RepID=UPI00391923FD
MTILRLVLWPLLALAAAIAAAAPAAAALTCTASVTGVAFGQITVRDGPRDRTTGTVNFSCSGGTPRAAVSACLALGAGSGGAAAGNVPRYMRRGDGASLNYDLRSGGQNGPTWNTVTTNATLNANGAANFSTTIFAEATSTGTAVKGGSYASSFSGADAVFSFGQGNCGTAGASPSFNVTATIAPSCTLDVSPLSFGSITALAGNTDAEATVTANCTSGVSYSISLGLGAGGGVTNPAARKMTKGSESITYGLYQNAARTTVWGDQTATDFDGAGTGASQQITVYGRIPPQMTPSAGTYSDTVIVTITY